MPFDLPNLPWWGWVVAAVVGCFLALFFTKFQKRSTSFVGIVIAVLSTLCLLKGIFEWVKG
jgi:type III secretory pathway component EscS